MKKTIVAIICAMVASIVLGPSAQALEFWEICITPVHKLSATQSDYSAYKVMDGANHYYVVYGSMYDSTIKLSDLKTFHQVYPSYPTGLGSGYTGSIFFEPVKNAVIDERLVGWSWNPSIDISGCAAAPGGAIAVMCTVMAQKDMSGSEVFRCAMVSRLGSAVTADTPPNEVKIQIGTAQACVHKSPEITLEALLINGEGKDPDADGWPNDFDNCDEDPNVDQADSDSDGQGDACEPIPDKDGDTIPDSTDNCPDVANTDQKKPYDTDGDGVGDSCTAAAPSATDTDGDGVMDDKDECPSQGVAGGVDELGCLKVVNNSDAANIGDVTSQGKDEGGACALMPMAQPGIGMLMLLATIVPLVIRRRS